MATLLRLALGVLVMAYVTAGAVVPVTTGSEFGTVELAWFLALTLVALPPLLLGSTVGYWSGVDRARMRRWIGIALATQIVGVVAMVVASTAGTTPLVPTLLLGAVGLAMLPAALALGNAARRADERRPRRDTAVPPEFAELVRTAWRRTGIGAAVGLVLGGVFLAWLVGGGADAPGPFFLVCIAVALVCLAAGAGLLTTIFPIARRVRSQFGGRYETAHRAQRVIAGRAEPRGDEEQLWIARWAAVQLRLVPLQAAQNCLLFGAVGLAHLGQLGTGELTNLRLVLVAATGVTLLAFVGASGWQLHRLRAYVAAHPVPDAPAGEPDAAPATEPG